MSNLEKSKQRSLRKSLNSDLTNLNENSESNLTNKSSSKLDNPDASISNTVNLNSNVSSASELSTTNTTPNGSATRVSTRLRKQSVKYSNYSLEINSSNNKRKSQHTTSSSTSPTYISKKIEATDSDCINEDNKSETNKESKEKRFKKGEKEIKEPDVNIGQQTPTQDAIKIKITRNSEQNQFTSEVTTSSFTNIKNSSVNILSVETSPKQVDLNQNSNEIKKQNCNSIKLNLGDLVRTCKTSLGILDENLAKSSSDSSQKSDSTNLTNKETESVQSEVSQNDANKNETSKNENTNEDLAKGKTNNVEIEEIGSKTCMSRQQGLKSENVNKIQANILKIDGKDSNDLRINLENNKRKFIDEIKSTYHQLFKEIKFNTDLRIKEILNESSLKVIKIQDEYEKKIKNIKLKQWCSNCGKEAFYYCCWNTSYCDQVCQSQHWVKHYKTCSRITHEQSESSNESNGNNHEYSNDYSILKRKKSDNPNSNKDQEQLRTNQHQINYKNLKNSNSNFTFIQPNIGSMSNKQTTLNSSIYENNNLI